MKTKCLLSLAGAGWDSSVLDKTYIVAGSVGKHKLYEYMVVDDNDARVYNNTVSHSQDADGVDGWNGILHNAEINPSYSGSPQELIFSHNNNNAGTNGIHTLRLDLTVPQLESNSNILNKDMLVRIYRKLGRTQV